MIDQNLLKVAEKLGVPGDFYIKDATKVCLSPSLPLHWTRAVLTRPIFS